jgi:hypothetical protein
MKRAGTLALTHFICSCFIHSIYILKYKHLLDRPPVVGVARQLPALALIHLQLGVLFLHDIANERGLPTVGRLVARARGGARGLGACLFV